MITAVSRIKGHPAVINNQNGSVIVMALFILALLTLVATNLSQNTNVELQIVRNDTAKRLQFYQAEAASREGAQVIETMDTYDLSDTSVIDWINQSELDLAAIDLNDVNDTWSQAVVDTAPASAKRIAYTVVDRSGPIDLSATSNDHEYAIMGAYDVAQGMRRGQVMVEIGYKRRF
jgi:Tfp pilus assembly protein PilX